MNKQEAIRSLKEMAQESFEVVKINAVHIDNIVEVINQIDEPQKVTIPKFVAEWLEENDWRKDTLGRQTIFDAFDNLTLDASNGLYVDVKKWVEENGNIFLQAWVFGYEVEKEKLYTARLKLLSFKKYSYINKNKDKKTLCLSDSDDLTDVYQTHFTQAELEGLGVWDNPAFEIEEVEA
ncbi:hypothetical protein P0092_40 [Streptococcus phage P0092]|uniref:DUF1642 domain-containing protein n=1 Tax=Streptococcus phage P0092 TaxID=1971411 RepID=A0A286QMN0_9CAUD|nr:hypothetical protein PQE82_gp40 [Streptococcus phage P0092]ARU13042.1 hypothetical protein P0092_40 [Streptococcus phage P0092]